MGIRRRRRALAFACPDAGLDHVQWDALADPNDTINELVKLRARTLLGMEDEELRRLGLSELSQARADARATDDLPDTPDIPSSNEVFVPAGTTTTASGRQVPRRSYTRRKTS